MKRLICSIGTMPTVWIFSLVITILYFPTVLRAQQSSSLVTEIVNSRINFAPLVIDTGKTFERQFDFKPSVTGHYELRLSSASEQLTSEAREEILGRLRQCNVDLTVTISDNLGREVWETKGNLNLPPAKAVWTLVIQEPSDAYIASFHNAMMLDSENSYRLSIKFSFGPDSAAESPKIDGSQMQVYLIHGGVPRSIGAAVD